MKPQPLTIYTVGHSNLSEDGPVALLQDHEVAMIVDVRSAPYSRFAPHFNHHALRTLLGRHEIDYHYAGNKLGGRPDDPACYKDGQVPEGHADYLNLVDYPAGAGQPWYQEGIARMLEEADGKRVATMCSEEDPHRCHRHHLIAQTLLELGTDVRHIRRTGKVEIARLREPEPQQIALFPQPA